MPDPPPDPAALSDYDVNAFTLLIRDLVQTEQRNQKLHMFLEELGWEQECLLLYNVPFNLIRSMITMS